MKSDLDVADPWGGTWILFDGDSGALRAVFLPSGAASGDTVTNWLYALHFAAVWGMPYRVVVTVLGLAVAGLAATGIYICWKKRRARLRAAARLPARGAPLESALRAE